MVEEGETENWLGCPCGVKEQLPRKIKQAVNFAMDECFRDIVGEPAAQRDKWLYKEIHAQICEAMQRWVKEALKDAMATVLEEDE